MLLSLLLAPDSVNTDEVDVPAYPVPTDDPSIRTNALYFQGTPLTELPTGKIFTYISSFSSSVPLGIEWIADDRELSPFPFLSSSGPTSRPRSRRSSPPSFSKTHFYLLACCTQVSSPSSLPKNPLPSRSLPSSSTPNLQTLRQQVNSFPFRSGRRSTSSPRLVWET